MRKGLIILSTFCLLFLLATPALADVNLNINGKSYQPLIQPRIEEGTTMVPAYVVGRVLGAEIATDGQNLDIEKNGRKLTLTLDNKAASLNGETVNLPVAPSRVNNEIIVPLRAVMDAFGAKIDWQGQSSTVLVDYQEQRQGMSVEEMLAKSSEALAAYNTYKTKVDMNQQIEVANPEKAGKKEKVDMKMNMEMAVQNKPVLVYGKTVMNMAAPGEAGNGLEALESEMLLNDEGMYITMPDQGWVKMTIPGMDIKALMEQAGSQDPMTSLKLLQDAGAIMSFGSDQQKNGQSYWIINVTMGTDSISRLTQDILKKVPLPQDEVPELDQAIAQVFKNMNADMVYSVWVNQKNFLTDYMQLDSDVSLNMQIPAEPDQPDKLVTMDMNMKQSAFYEIYDLGVPFTVPDVSKAVDMNEVLQKQK
ncbi:DUF6612 family protein [Syntrophomonas curvata]